MHNLYIYSIENLKNRNPANVDKLLKLPKWSLHKYDMHIEIVCVCVRHVMGTQTMYLNLHQQQWTLETMQLVMEAFLYIAWGTLFCQSKDPRHRSGNKDTFLQQHRCRVIPDFLIPLNVKVLLSPCLYWTHTTWVKRGCFTLYSILSCPTPCVIINYLLISSFHIIALPQSRLIQLQNYKTTKLFFHSFTSHK